MQWAVLDMRKTLSPLRRAWYEREPDLTMSRHFRNGEDIAVVVGKLQSLALDDSKGSQSDNTQSMVSNWDYVNPRAVYSEYVTSPYLNHKYYSSF